MLNYRNNCILLILLFALIVYVNLGMPLAWGLVPDSKISAQIAESLKSTILVKLHQTSEQYQALRHVGKVDYPDGQRINFNQPFEERLLTKNWLKKEAGWPFDDNGIYHHRATDPTFYTLKLRKGVSPAKAISDLKKDPKLKGIVKFVEPEQIASIQSSPNDPLLEKQWHLQDELMTVDGQKVPLASNVSPLWEVYLSSASQATPPLISVIDTGVDHTHEDLTDSVEVNIPELIGKFGVDDDNNGFVDDIYGYNFSGTSGLTFGDETFYVVDDNGHGTRVAGAIAAISDNSLGVSSVSWNARILVVKGLDFWGSGTYSSIIDSIDYSILRGANIICISWGGAHSELLREAIERAADMNIMIVASSGNLHRNVDKDSAWAIYPASYVDLPNVISVTSTGPSGKISSFSNVSSNLVHLAAPGEDILTTSSKHPYLCILGETGLCEGYSVYSGTSLAAAQVAGAVSLLSYLNPSWSLEKIRQRLVETSDRLPGYGINTLSAGKVNFFHANDESYQPPPLIADQPEPGDIVTAYCMSKSGQLKLCPLKPNGQVNQNKIKIPISKYYLSKNKWKEGTTSIVDKIKFPNARFMRLHLATSTLRALGPFCVDMVRLLNSQGFEYDRIYGKTKAYSSNFVRGDKILLELVSEGSLGCSGIKKYNKMGFTFDYLEVVE